MARKTPCEQCEQKFWKKDLVFGPDPFNSDVHGDDTPVWLCSDCHHESYMDI